MNALEARGPRVLSWSTELTVVVVLAWAAFVAIPLTLGEIGLGWDALNHHIYLGWTAQAPRFDRDFMAASGQSYQYPYLYWPVYKLAMAGASGVQAGVVLASLHVTVVPGVWLLARACIGERSWYGFSMRLAAVVLGFLSIVALSMFDSTSNDLLAAAPMVWSIALAVESFDPARPLWLTPQWATAASGVMAGMAVAFKLSNGPLAVVLPVLWVAHVGPIRLRLRLVTIGCAATLAGFVIFYGYWGWQLWMFHGNPMYPFFEGTFSVVRRMAGWKP
jgi:hypothetical protein